MVCRQRGSHVFERHALLLTVALSLILPVMPARADELQEVVVTARKREESILKVPVVETAITAQELTQFATADLHGVARQVPDLLFGNATGAFGAQVSLRGVGTSTLNAAIDQSVSLNLDGLQVSQGLAYQAAIRDGVGTHPPGSPRRQRFEFRDEPARFIE